MHQEQKRSGPAFLVLAVLLVLLAPALGLGGWEWWRQQRAIRRGEVVRRAVESLGGKAKTVRVTYAVGGGIFFVGHRPSLRGYVATDADKEALREAIEEACRTAGIEVPKGCQGVSVGAPGRKGGTAEEVTK